MFATTSQPQGFVQHGQGGGGVVGKVVEAEVGEIRKMMREASMTSL